jgi:tetratricopeptide (TPR) repeat protein
VRVIAIVVVAVLAMSGAAGAESKMQAAREAAENGRRAYNLSHWDEAIAGFEKAYQLSGDPALLFNLAQAHRQAGHGNEALHFYKTYLREQPGGPNREIAEKQLNELQAQNWYDPFETGPPPPARFPPPPSASARPVAPPPAAPATPARATDDWPPPAPPRATDEWPPPAAAGSSLTVVPPPASATPATTDAPVVVSPPAGPARRTPLPRWLPLAGAAATVALMTGAIVEAVSASKRYDDLSSSCGQTAAGCAAGDIDAVRSRDRAATALWIATGVVAAATGVSAYVNARAAGVSALWKF